MEKNTSRLANGKTSQEVRDLSVVARRYGVGNSDFGSMRKLEVTVSPSSICRAYAKELFDAMLQTVMISTGNPNVTLPYTESDLYAYLSILLRERIVDVRKGRTLFPRSDSDIKIPHFYMLMLASLGDVVDEERHMWVESDFDYSESDALQLLYSEAATDADIKARQAYTVYSGEVKEREFCYTMSKFLTMMERYGFVNGTALPRGLTGDLQFMLFVWFEGRLFHSEPNVEPGTAVLASLLNFSRDTTILNPYISYGAENVHRILLKEVTTPRGRTAS